MNTFIRTLIVIGAFTAPVVLIRIMFFIWGVDTSAFSNADRALMSFVSFFPCIVAGLVAVDCTK